MNMNSISDTVTRMRPDILQNPIAEWDNLYQYISTKVDPDESNSPMIKKDLWNLLITNILPH